MSTISPLLERLSLGHTLIKYPKKPSKRPEEYILRLDTSTAEVIWSPLKKKKTKRRENCIFQSYLIHFAVDIADIKEIRQGKGTRAFEMHGKEPLIEDRAFSIIYTCEGEYKMLDFGELISNFALSIVNIVKLRRMLRFGIIG